MISVRRVHRVHRVHEIPFTTAFSLVSFNNMILTPLNATDGAESRPHPRHQHYTEGMLCNPVVKGVSPSCVYLYLRLMKGCSGFACNRPHDL